MSNGDSNPSPESDETLDAFSDWGPRSAPEHGRLRRIGDYELISEIARGGMGIVYRAKQLSLNRIVAVKIIRRAEYATEMDRLRFRAEAEAAANLDHPNIVPIHEVGEDGGEPYFSMRLIEGGSLADSIRLGRWPIDQPDTLTRATVLVATVARAVHAAHQFGVLHRDLKPGNILLDANHTPFVTDFGLAKRVDAETPGLDHNHMTQTGEIIGTPAFMSPEQASGKKGLTTAADVYSLGAILYTLLAGKTPFHADSPLDLLQRVVSEPAPSLRKLNAQVDLDLATICEKCLEKEPSKRYASSLALAEDLDRWNRDEPIHARPVSKFETFKRWGKRNPKDLAMWATVAGAIALLGLILALGYSSAFKQAADGRRREYLHDMTNAMECIKAGQELQAFNLLSRHGNSSPVDDDYRDWEWHHLRHQCRVKMLLSHANCTIKWNDQLTRCFISDLANDKVLIGTIKGVSGPRGNSTADSQLNLTSQSAFDFSLQTVLSNSPKSSVNGCWDRTGDLFALVDIAGLRLLSATTGSVVWKAKHSTEGYLPAVSWSQSGALVAVGTSTGHVDILDATDGHLVNRLDDEAHCTFGFGPEDRWFAIGNTKGTRFFDPVSGSLLRSTDWSMNALSRDGRWIGSEKSIRNSDSGEVVASRESPVVRSWSPDGSTCVELVGGKYQVYRQDFKTIEFEFPSQYNRIPGTISNDGAFMLEDAVSWSYLWDLKQRGDATEWVKPSLLPNAVGLRDDGSLIAYAELADQTSVHMYNAQSFQDLSTIHGEQSKVLSVAVHPTRPELATLDEAGALRIWNTDSRTEITQLKGLPAKTNDRSNSYWKVAYNEDGTQLAAGGGGTIVLLWQTQTWNESKRLEGDSLRLVGWLKGSAVVQATNRPVPSTTTSNNRSSSSQFQVNLPQFNTEVILPKGHGSPPDGNRSHVLFLTAGSETNWTYVPIEFDEVNALLSKDAATLIECNKEGVFFNPAMDRRRTYSTQGRRLDLGTDGCVVLKEKSTGVRISLLADHVRRLNASADRSTVLLDTEAGIQCRLAPRSGSPLLFTPFKSTWPYMVKDASSVALQILVMSLVFWFPIFVSRECLRKRMRPTIAFLIGSFYCAVATLFVDRDELMLLAIPVFLPFFGTASLLAVPFLLRIATLANQGKLLRLAMFVLAACIPSLVYFLWSFWPANSLPNGSIKDSLRAGLGIFTVIVLSYSIIPFYRYMRDRTHPDFHELNPVLFQVVLGIANRTEAFMAAIAMAIVSTLIFAYVFASGLLQHIRMQSQLFSSAQLLAIFLVGSGLICLVTSITIIYYVFGKGLTQKRV